MESNLRKGQRFYLFWKRIFDIFLSIIGILLCVAFIWWWVIIVNAIVTKGHPFFLSKRLGKNNKEFNVIKFRSMKLSVANNVSSEKADLKAMLTPFGKFLRKTSIDETPQFLNVFIGQMAMVGPRPLIDNPEDHITIEERNKNNAYQLKPGITGYAQVHGRTAVTPLKKGYFDGIYFQRMNIWLDFKIIIYTIFKIFGAVKGR